MYLGYVAQFATSPEVRRKLEELILSNGLVFDFQRMYLLAAALSCDKVRKEVVNKALRFLDNRSVGQEVRAIAAIFAAKLGQFSYNRQSSRNVQQSLHVLGRDDDSANADDAASQISCVNGRDVS